MEGKGMWKETVRLSKQDGWFSYFHDKRLRVDT